MAEIHRNDGKHFAVNTYREVLQNKKTSILKAEIELLARSHGKYVYLQKQSNNEIKAIFSRESGYLLGEALREHYHKHTNLIYCEALNPQEYLVVIIRAGSVYLDTVLPNVAMIEEITSLLSIEQVQYKCYAFGELPNLEWANKFQILPKALSDSVVLDAGLQLIPLEQALKSAGVGQSNGIYVLAGLAIMAVLGVWFFLDKEPAPERVISNHDSMLQGYEQALRAPLMEVEMGQLATVLEKMYTLRGWVPVTVNMDEGNYKITLNSDGGNLEQLQEWAGANHVNVQMSERGAELTYRARPQNRVEYTPIQPIDLEINKIISRLSGFSTDKNITIGQSRSVNHIREANVSVRFANASPSILRLIGQRLSGLPVKLDNASTRFEGGLITGTIQLTVVGQ